MIAQALFSNNSDEWETPKDLFDRLNDEFHFTLDVCAIEDNAKCAEYISPLEDGLKQDWYGTCWMNPPYSDIGKWMQKAYEESFLRGITVVCLIPARTDTRYFHQYIYHKSEIRFIRGRLKFSNSKNSAPFPSMIVIYRGLERSERT